MALTMLTNPLCPPPDAELLQRFVRHFTLPEDTAPRDMLRSIAVAFAQLPYENLTKIIKHDEAGRPESCGPGTNPLTGT
jgi:hypothetical protein